MLLNKTKIKRINKMFKSMYTIIPASTIKSARFKLSHDGHPSYLEQLSKRKRWKMNVREVVMQHELARDRH